MRMQLEGLSEQQAVDAVLRDNIHGLELDQRCVELAAFALALEAWRYPNAGGYRVLPELQLACSGMSITEAQKEWKDLAKGDEALTDAIAWMQETFKDAPILGSLIDPLQSLDSNSKEPWSSLLENMECSHTTDASRVLAQGIINASSLLSQRYDLIITNPPYLGEKKQNPILRDYSKKHFHNARADLATTFVSRGERLVSKKTQCLVLPQNWLYQSSYKQFRRELLAKKRISFIAQLGSNAFESQVGADVVLLILNDSDQDIVGLDSTQLKAITDKQDLLASDSLLTLQPNSLLEHSDSRIVLSERNTDMELLEQRAQALAGINNGDNPRFTRNFWDFDTWSNEWQLQQTTSVDSCFYSGLTQLFRWCNGGGVYKKHVDSLNGRLGGSWKRGHNIWGKRGVSISQMGQLVANLYSTELYDQSVAMIVPTEDYDLPGIWAFCQSSKFNEEVRKIDKKKNVTNATLVKIPFDKNHWGMVAKDNFPNGLPLPYSDDPTQWIFHGHPCASVIWNEESKTTAVGALRQDDTVLQVAVARLLGYQWPAELDPEMELAPEMREVMKKNADFAGLIDDDGIVCIPAVRGEKTAAKRLEAILHKAYGDEWTSSVEQNLLKAVKAKDLESWLRDKFFDQHTKLFQHRPFIWQIWDGLKDGFSALVNYHMLDYKGLERLIYTYLDDWISTQKRDLADGKDGADIRLTAAENLKKQLEAILAGEKDLDIFVRWKSLAEQPVGWNPDLNDGVRLNIRPFMLAKDVGKKGAGVLRGKPNIHWKKDRGTDVAYAPWFDLGPVYGESEGSRINDHHLTLAEKKAAREQVND